MVGLCLNPAGPAGRDVLKGLPVRPGPIKYLVLVFWLLMTAFGADTAAERKTGLKAPHPEQPQPQRTNRNELTAEVSRRLPRRPRIEARRRNYIDDHIFGKMEQDKIPHAGLSSDQEFLRR